MNKKLVKKDIREIEKKLDQLLNLIDSIESKCKNLDTYTNDICNCLDEIRSEING